MNEKNQTELVLAKTPQLIVMNDEHRELTPMNLKRKIESLQCIVAQLLAENERLRQMLRQMPSSI